MITHEQYKLAAAALGCEVAAIKAVDTVESNGGGMSNGQPVILFEPHIFWRELFKAGISPTKYTEAYSDILYKTWGEKPYPKGQQSQYDRLQKAMLLHKEAALKSCSWGRFQIMGFNYAASGCADVLEFVERMKKGDAEQLWLFVAFVKNQNMHRHLVSKNWTAFAKAYNGPGYTKNKYDIKLAEAYQKLKG